MATATPYLTPILPKRPHVPEKSFLLTTYLVSEEDLEGAINVASKPTVELYEAWYGVALTAVGVEDMHPQLARDGLLVIYKSNILGSPDHPEYETAWTAVRELGDYAADFSQQSSDEALDWEILAHWVESLVRSATA